MITQSNWHVWVTGMSKEEISLISGGLCECWCKAAAGGFNRRPVGLTPTIPSCASKCASLGRQMESCFPVRPHYD